jgi:hypothetical protein
MVTRNLDKSALLPNEDWYGNNAAVACPVCGKTFIVSGFISKGRRRCPKCQKSAAEITTQQVTIEWPIAADEPRVLARRDLENKKRLEEFIQIVAEGGAVRSRSIKDRLPRAERIAFIERDGKMIAVASLKRADQGYAVTLTKNSGYQLPGDSPELGYVAVSPAW